MKMKKEVRSFLIRMGKLGSKINRLKDEANAIGQDASPGAVRRAVELQAEIDKLEQQREQLTEEWSEFLKRGFSPENYE